MKLLVEGLLSTEPTPSSFVKYMMRKLTGNWRVVHYISYPLYVEQKEEKTNFEMSLAFFEKIFCFLDGYGLFLMVVATHKTIGKKTRLSSCLGDTLSLCQFHSLKIHFFAKPPLNVALMF